MTVPTIYRSTRLTVVAAAVLLFGVLACSNTETVVETVVHTVEVERVVTEQVVETVEVERVVTEQVIETVEVLVTPTATSAPLSREPVTPPAPQSGDSEVVFAVFNVGSQNGRNGAGASTDLRHHGLAETLFMRGPADETLPWIGAEWSLAPDLSSARIDIDTRAEFRWLSDSGVESLGNVSAADVAWSMNDASVETNPDTEHDWAFAYADFFGEWIAVDEDTVEFELRAFDTGWNSFFLSESGPGIPIFSKSAFDSFGESFLAENVIGTGVYLVEEWVDNDRLTQVSVAAAGAGDHWKFDAGADRITFLEVPEPDTQAALLAIGEADIAGRFDLLSDRDTVFDFVEGGFSVARTGNMTQQGIFFSGNLWEETSALDGSPLLPETYRHDLAWIGDPEDPDDLQEAKSIRNALARAYDRDAINERLIGGLGIPVEVEYFSTEHPRWRQEWNYGYDPELARQIIRGESEEWPLRGGASYRRDQTTDAQQESLNGNAFSVSLYAGSLALDGGIGLNGEIIDAVAGYWADLGLQVFTLKFSYPTFRPTIVGRTNTHPFVTECDLGWETTPWHQPRGLQQTSLSRGGFSCGFEIPFVLDNYMKTLVEPDEETRNQLIDEYAQYMYDEALQPGIVAVPRFWIMNPNRVASWDAVRVEEGPFARVWQIELR